MPLDNIGYLDNVEQITPVSRAVRDIDPLEAMGITPVSEKAVRAYKAAYRRKHSAYSIGASWRTVKHPKGIPLIDFLRSPFARILTPSPDILPPPRVLIDLALQVHVEMPGALFTAEYYSLDPILNVTYLVGGVKRKRCLGIWDGNTIKAIASHS